MKKADKMQKLVTDDPGETQALYQGLMNSLPNPVIIHVNGKVVFANDVILSLSGHEKEEIIGKDLEEILVDPVDPVNTSIRIVYSAIQMSRRRRLSSERRTGK